MKVVLNDFIGVRGRSGSSRGADLVAAAVSSDAVTVQTLRPKAEPQTRAFRLLHMLFWDFVGVPYKSSLLGADLVIHATNTGISFGKARSVVILHDTMVLDHPKMFSSFFVLYAKFCMWVSVRKSWLVVTPSEHSKSRIKARWPKAHVRVIPWPFYAEGGETESNLDALHSARPSTLTVLVVSSIDKHKRLPLAIEAVKNARIASGDDFKLVMVTRPGNDQAAFKLAVASADPEGQWISVCSGVDDETLSRLYRQAFCVLVSSIDEGFCLPALEASASGVPVVHTNRGALPEVIPRGLTACPDPSEDSAVLRTQILELLDTEKWRKFRDAGRVHAATFSTRNFRAKWAAVLHEAGMQ